MSIIMRSRGVNESQKSSFRSVGGDEFGKKGKFVATTTTASKKSLKMQLSMQYELWALHPETEKVPHLHVALRP